MKKDLATSALPRREADSRASVAPFICLILLMTGCQPQDGDSQDGFDQDNSKAEADRAFLPGEIVTRVSPSPEDRYLAFITRLGAPVRGPSDRSLMVVPISQVEDTGRLNLNSELILCFAWRPNAHPPTLFLIIASKSGQAMRLIAVHVGNGLETQLSRRLADQTVVSALHWNPDGSVLAACVVVINEHSADAYLGLSEDSGQTIVATNIRLAGTSMTWLDESTLYVEAPKEFDEQILELNVNGTQASVVSVVAEGYDLHLYGSTGGELVYRAQDTLFRGSQVLYESPVEIDRAIAAGSFVVVSTDETIVVLDASGRTIASKRLPPGARLGAFSPHENAIYILTRGNTTIERWDGLTLEGAQAEYSVVYSLRDGSSR